MKGAQKNEDPKMKSDKLLAALDLMEFAIELMRQNLIRKLPKASPMIIESELNRWLMQQPNKFVPFEAEDYE